MIKKITYIADDGTEFETEEECLEYEKPYLMLKDKDVTFFDEDWKEISAGGTDPIEVCGMRIESAKTAALVQKWFEMYGAIDPWEGKTPIAGDYYWDEKGKMWKELSEEYRKLDRIDQKFYPEG